MPNLLSKRPAVAHIVALAPCDNPANRLLLMGGHGGFLDLMAKDRVKPESKTFAQLLAMVGDTRMEVEILEAMEKAGVQPTTSLYNQLIKARSARKDYDLGRATLGLIFEQGLAPDIQTFGVLALCCR